MSIFQKERQFSNHKHENRTPSARSTFRKQSYRLQKPRKLFSITQIPKRSTMRSEYFPVLDLGILEDSNILTEK